MSLMAFSGSVWALRLRIFVRSEEEEEVEEWVVGWCECEGWRVRREEDPAFCPLNS